MPDLNEEIEQYMRETNTTYAFAEAVIASRQPQTEVKETVSEEVEDDRKKLLSRLLLLKQARQIILSKKQPKPKK